PYGQVTDGGLEESSLDVDSSSGVRSSWTYAFLWARAGTIYSGSSEIQKNVIGERVLGLPKEIRADRVKSSVAPPVPRRICRPCWRPWPSIGSAARHRRAAGCPPSRAAAPARRSPY